MTKLTCHYCEIYQKCPSNKRIDKNKPNDENSRFCHNERDFVSEERIVGDCQHFELSKYFWCDNSHNWVNVIACTEGYNCHCKSGNILSKYLKDNWEVIKKIKGLPENAEKQENKPIKKKVILEEEMEELYGIELQCN